MSRKKIQSYIKFFIQRIFILIYGKIKTPHSSYRNNVEFTHIKDIKSDTYPNRQYFLYKIKNGRIYTDTNQTVSIVNKDNIISEASFQHVDNELKNTNSNSALTKGTPNFKKKIDGTVFNLTQGGSGNNYFHFIFDIIPKIYLLEKNLPIKSIDYFYVPEIKSWQKKIYQLFDINEKKLIDSKKYRHIQGDLIVAVSHPWYFKGDFQNETKNIPEWIIRYNRNKFLPLMKKFDSNTKVFLDRSSSNFNHCQIKNNNEVTNFFKKRGFTIYNPEKLSIQEQIYLFNQASIVAGAHGAAFTNIIFCKPTTKIIEIIPESHPSKKCERISTILKLNYFRIKTIDNNFDKNFPDTIFLTEKNLKEISDITDLY